MAIVVNCNFSLVDPPACVVGVPYSHFFTATGGAGPPYNWGIFPGLLPDGVHLNAFTGEISGTPTGADFLPGETSHQSFLRVIASSGSGGSFEEGVMQCGMAAYLNTLPLTASCNNPPGGSIGLAYTHSFTAIQGIAPYTFTISSGALPGGLAMDASGNITGIPLANGLFTFAVTVTGTGDPTNNVATISCQISIGGVAAVNFTQLYFYAFGFPGPLLIDCNNPPNGVVDVPYTHWILAAGGVPPYTFALIAGSLPPGLSLDPSSGLITGTPTTVGVYGFTVQVSDSEDTEASVECSIEIDPPLEITCDDPPDGTVGVAYSHFFPATGGVPPYTFDISAGALPDGLTIDAATGEVSGVPTVGGTFNFTVRVTDSYTGGPDPNVAEVECSITIVGVGGLTIECGNPPSGNVGITYAHTFPASGGTSPYVFSIFSGSLPPGLALDPSTGVVAGKPTLSGFYEFVVRVTDAHDSVSQVECSILIKRCLLVDLTT